MNLFGDDSGNCRGFGLCQQLGCFGELISQPGAAQLYDRGQPGGAYYPIGLLTGNGQCDGDAARTASTLLFRLPAPGCAGATRAFTPATVTPTAGPGTTALSITLAKVAAAVPHRSNPLFPEATLATIALCFFGFKRRYRLQGLVLLVVATLGLGLLSGCATGTNQSTTATVTVTATSGALQQTATLPVTVR